jgi:sialate O-acetylesterase
MRTLLCAAILAVLVPAARADVKLPTIFGSHMVLQRGKDVPVWGWAEAGEKVTVTLGEASKEATADAKGNWSVKLPAMKANAKGQKLVVKSDKNTITLDDVLVGDVWVGSGQSNMQWSVAASAKSKEVIAAARNPNIRLYLVPLIEAAAPTTDIKAAWKECTPANVPSFSAVLYQFGLAIQKDQKIPVGLIASSWGGSPIEPWIVTEKGSGRKYNAMIAPISKFPIKGVIWYQGESNASQGMKYVALKEQLIKGWRKFWGKDMPFYFVQIAPFTYGGAPDMLPKFWEAQCACLKIPNTGMVVITDVTGNVKDIHPRDKETVGKRLALWALAKNYGKKDVVYSGPLFKSAKFDGGKAVVSFAHAKGLKSRDDKALTTFEVAGEDGKFVAAEAKIDGDTVVVTAKDVEKPTQVRFGWSKTTNPNLCNGAGLPASPFQSKDWKGGTGE